MHFFYWRNPEEEMQNIAIREVLAAPAERRGVSLRRWLLAFGIVGAAAKMAWTRAELTWHTAEPT